MAEKKSRYVSVCKRDKPIRTNHRPRFIMHVASCPTCRRKLSKSSIEELQPELSQFMAKHIMRKDGASRVSEEQKAQLDVLIRDTQSFQYLAECNLKLLEQFNCFKKEASAEMETFGKMLDRKLQEDRGGWPSPPCPPEEIPVGMRAEHRSPPGNRKPYKAPEPFKPDLPPPFQGPPISDPLPTPPLPDLDTAEEFDTFTKYLAKQRRRLQDLGLLPEAKTPPISIPIEIINIVSTIYEKQIERLMGLLVDIPKDFFEEILELIKKDIKQR